MANRAERHLSVSRSSEEVFVALRQSLEELPASIVSADPKAGEILAKTKRGLKSFGETIHVTLESQGQAQTSVSLRSKSTWKTTLVDWGKNRENVDRLIEALRANLKSQVP